MQPHLLLLNMWLKKQVLELMLVQFVQSTALFVVVSYHILVLSPFYKHFQTAVKSVAQGGIRGGAATLFYPIWHLEVESLLVLKNNRGVEENRVRHLDYGVQLNRLMYQRLIQRWRYYFIQPI